MDLSELHRVQRQERSTDSLQELRESFYADVAAYLESLREKRAEAAEQAPNPFQSSQVRELSDEIETAEQVVEAIYQRRIGKLVDEATLTATGNGGGTEGLTAEEKALYEDLVGDIRENREAVLETVAGDRTPAVETEADSPASDPDPDRTDPPSDTADRVPPDPPEEPSSTAAAMDPDPADSGTDSDTDAAAPDGVDRRTVQITTDVGEIFGVDAEEYDLQADDVIDLPRENADPLVDRDAANRVE